MTTEQFNILKRNFAKIHSTPMQESWQCTLGNKVIDNVSDYLILTTPVSSVMSVSKNQKYTLRNSRM